jgi:hypothetical protein
MFNNLMVWNLFYYGYVHEYKRDKIPDRHMPGCYWVGRTAVDGGGGDSTKEGKSQTALKGGNHSINFIKHFYMIIYF